MSASYEDVAAPSVQLAGPVEGAPVHGSVELSATAADNARVSAVRFYLDGALIATDTDPPYRASFSTANRPHGADVVVLARATDPSGHESDIVAGVNQRAYTIDNQVSARFIAPTPAQDAVIRTAAPALAFVIDPDGAPGGGSFECAVNGGALAPCGSPFVPSTVADGIYTVDVRASDAATPTPNRITLSRRFVVDRTAPNVSIATPAEGSRHTGPFTPVFRSRTPIPIR